LFDVPIEVGFLSEWLLLIILLPTLQIFRSERKRILMKILQQLTGWYLEYWNSLLTLLKVFKVQKI